ncbi:MAG TPA: helix-turn-helix transcriptional regulator [Candidatus Angelobacter sp.]|jgi:DNA-binding transcriptional ArsR family regulator|nr:helix-turn-helix transcriptional regulator [Candidatus Angelobacter sp.]
MNQPIPGEAEAGAAVEPCAEPVTAGPYPVADITAVLQALGDPVRMAIVRGLAKNGDPLSCGSFELAVTKSTLSHHFRVLKESGIIDAHYEGTRKMLTLRREALDEVYPGLLDSILRATEAATATAR